MSKYAAIFISSIIFSASGLVADQPLKAELVLPGDRTWKGELVSREGGMLNFKKEGAESAVQIGADTVIEINFDIGLDRENLKKLLGDREYKTIIGILENALTPYTGYDDIPNNLTFYNHTLMTLSFWSGDYEKTLQLCDAIRADDRDPKIQVSRRIFESLSLIETGQTEKAEAMLNRLGWDKELADNAGAEKLYISARLYRLKKEYKKAIETVAKVVAFYPDETDWLPAAELLCAELYAEMGMYDSAKEVIRHIQILHKNTPESEKATELKERVILLSKDAAAGADEV
ncbi:MAG: hypothetical protein K9M45_06000 [Kiritimatiellales bacterium]|nr:hypothetical protein [Kiritimatiellales bacterium]